MTHYDLKHESLYIDGDLVSLADLSDDEIEKCDNCGAIQLKEDISWMNRLCAECDSSEEGDE
jgi:hypothetical protein